MPELSTILTDPELQMYLLSFLGVRDLWSLQLTSQSNRASVQGYLRSKFIRYLSRVLANTSGMFNISAIYLVVF